MQRPTRKRSSHSNEVSTDSGQSDLHPEKYNGNRKAKSKRSLRHFATSFLLLIAVAVFMVGCSDIYGKSKGKHVGESPTTSLTVAQIQSKFRGTERRSENQDAVIVEESDPAGNLKAKEDPASGHSFPEPPEFDTDGKTRLHLIFSTDCSDYQHWQSYLLFHSALKVGQPGLVTRIASGCNELESTKAKAWHEEHVKNVMSDRFHLHFTPQFSSFVEDGGKKAEYKYFNKPFGLLHWLEHGKGMGTDPATGKLIDEDVVIILTDPDMLMLRPIGADFSNMREVLHWPPKKEGEEWKFRVQHGSPFAQKYGVGTKWREFNLTTIAGEDSPSKLVENKFARFHYSVGPPYIATGRDMYNIAQKWSEFAPLVHVQHPHLLAEMYAYCVAAAHLELPHQLVESMMISLTGTKRLEGWPLLSDLPAKNVCEFASYPDHSAYAVPNVVHYCQSYEVDKWTFQKRKFRKDFFTCESSLMAIPPADLAVSSEVKVRNAAFFVCAMISALNDAASFFKSNHCEGT